MIANDYQKFEQEFSARFPDASTRLAQRGTAARKAWADSLYDVTLTDATEALRAIHRGDEGSVPFLDEFPGSVRRIAKRLADARQKTYYTRHGEQVGRVECLKCGGGGLVSIYHPETIQAAKQDAAMFRDQGAVHTAFAVCGCRAADRWNRSAYKDGKHFLPVFDEQRMFIVGSAETLPKLTPEQSRMDYRELMATLFADEPQHRRNLQQEAREAVLVAIDAKRFATNEWDGGWNREPGEEG